MSEDITEKEITLKDVWTELVKVNERLDKLENKFDESQKKFDDFQRDSEVQFEAIRTGIVANSSAFDRLSAKVLNLSVDVKDLSEEVRQSQKSLSLK